MGDSQAARVQAGHGQQPRQGWRLESQRRVRVVRAGVRAVPAEDRPEEEAAGDGKRYRQSRSLADKSKRALLWRLDRTIAATGLPHSG